MRKDYVGLATILLRLTMAPAAKVGSSGYQDHRWKEGQGGGMGTASVGCDAPNESFTEKEVSS